MYTIQYVIDNLNKVNAYRIEQLIAILMAEQIWPNIFKHIVVFSIPI